MKRRDFLASAIAIAAMPRIAAAQGVPRAARIGWLTAQNQRTPGAAGAGIPILYVHGMFLWRSRAWERTLS
jgi:hypothetical protein